MSKDSGDDTQQVKSVQQPWGPQGQRWEQSLRDLDRLRSTGGLRVNPYPGQTVAPLSGETEGAWTGTAQRAQDGSPLNAAAGQHISRLLDPSFLTSDSPGLSSVLDSAANDVNARFSMAGRTFSGGHANALNQSQGQLRYQDYLNKMNQAQQAAQFAPQLAREDYFDLGQLGQVGSQREAYGQDLINADINRFNALQNAPINELALYQQLIGGNLGGTTVSTQPRQQQGNQTLGLIGGLGQLAASLPWGW